MENQILQLLLLGKIMEQGGTGPCRAYEVQMFAEQLLPGKSDPQPSEKHLKAFEACTKNPTS